MTFRKNTLFNTTRITAVLSIAAIVISLIVLSGWLLRNEILTSIRPEWVGMKVNAAIGTLCAVGSLLLFTGGKRKELAIFFAVVTFLIGAITLGEYLFRWDAGIDEFFITDTITPVSMYPGRMSPVTASGLIITGISLLFFLQEKTKWIIDIFAIMILAVAFLPFTGYLYNAERLYTIANFNSISIFSTLGLVFISLAILFSKPGTGLMAVYNEETKAAKQGTRHILFLFIVLLAFGWLCLKGYDAGYYDMQFGMGIMIAAFAVIFFFTSTAGIRNLNLAEKERERLYKMKEESEAFSRGILSSLISHIGVMDENGILITVNSAWEAFSKKIKDKGLPTLERLPQGSNCLEAYKKAAADGNDFAAKALQGIYSVFNKETKLFELRYPCYAGDKECWFLFRVMNFESGIQKVVMSHLDITEVMKARIRAEQSEKNLRQVMDNSTWMIASIDREYRLIIFNKALSDEYKLYTGSVPEPGIVVYNAFSPEGQAVWKSKVDEALAGNAVTFERSYEIGGQTKHTEVFLYPIKNGHAAEGVTCFIMDITERIKAQLALAERENHLRSIYETEPECIKLLGPKGELLEMNPAGLAMIEADDLEMVKGKPVLGIVAPGYRDAFAKLTQNVFKGESGILEFEITGLKGTHRWLETHAVPLKDAGGKIISLLSVTRDITERRKMEAEKEKLLNVLQKSLNEIYIFNADTFQFEYVNNGALSNTGYSIEEMLSMTPLDIKPEYTMEKFRDLIAPLINHEKEKIIFETVHKRADGSLYPAEIHLQLITYSGQSVFLAVILDTTVRKKAEQQLRESEERYHSLVEQASDGVLVADFQGNIIELNSALCSMFGYTRQEIMLKKTPSFIDPEDLKLKPFRFDLLSREGSVLQERLAIRKDGTKFNMEMNTKLLGEGKTLSIIRDISERKKAEAQIRQSEEKYRSFFNQSADAIFIFDETGHFLDMNTVSTRLLGYTREELRNMTVFDINFKEDLIANPIRLDLLATGEAVIRQRVFRKKDGSPVDVEVHSKKLPDGKFLGIVRDITERKKAEEALKESETKYRLIVGTTDEMMQRLSQEGKITWVNESWKINMGFTDKEVIGKQFTDFLDEATKIELGKVFPQLMKGKKVGNLSCGFITKNREVIFLEGQALPVISQGKIAGSQAFLRNVTERKKGEEKIREQEGRFKSLVDTAPDATVIVDEKGIIRIANLQAVKLLGYTKAELTGMPVEMLMPQSAHHKHKAYRHQYMHDPHTRPMGSGRDLVAVRKDGVEIPVEISLASFRSEEGSLITASLRDITQRKKAEKELDESFQSVRRLTEHLQNIREEERTHIAREIHDELGQQLTVMMMDVAFLDKRIEAKNSVAKEKIKELMEMLESTVKSVRKISSELRPSILDDLGLAAAMDLHLKEFEKRSGIATHLATPKKELKLTNQVKNTLFRIFQESLTNVARHSGAKNVSVKLEMKNNKIVLMIEDDGAGFDEKKAAAKRTLGVLGMKERAVVVGGEYLISGEPGKGTTILVSVPVQE